jgi:predicted aminopeptidase
MINIRFSGRILLALALPFLFSSCYYLKQGRYLLGHHFRARDVEKVLADAGTPEQVRDFLLEASRIRRFAVDTLGLKENKNYTTYSESRRDFLAYVVSAAEPLALETRYWNYPFLGKAPYRGFYEEQDARKEAGRLQEEGWDVWIRRVDAFSTLGILKDPLYDFMTDYPVYRLAELLIHEQTHATLWVKNDTAFNEDLASFVGVAGARLYLEAEYGPDSPEVEAMSASRADAQRYTEDVFALRRRLESLYAEAAALTLTEDVEEQYRDRKARIIEDFQQEFLSCYNARYTTELYKGFGNLPVNNAYLELFQLYQGREDWFAALFKEEGGDMKRFFRRVRREKGLPPE